MIEQLNEIGILVSALLALAVGSIWYSPLCFGIPWRRARNHGEEEALHPIARKQALVFSGVGILLALCVASVIQILLGILIVSGGVHLGTLLLLILTPSLVTIIGIALSEGRTLLFTLIHGGYVALTLTLMSVVIMFWPW